ncbi:hypothetical protein [Rhodoflexus sp.]
MFTRVNYFRWLMMGLLVVATLFSGCVSGKKGKKVKRGKPIPCPVKDC